jgi:hypothetical protein
LLALSIEFGQIAKRDSLLSRDHYPSLQIVISQLCFQVAHVISEFNHPPIAQSVPSLK